MILEPLSFGFRIQIPSPENMYFHAIIEHIRRASALSGKAIFVSGEAALLPFLSYRFGVPQNAWFVDVSYGGDTDTISLLNIMRQSCTATRWRPVVRSILHHSYETSIQNISILPGESSSSIWLYAHDEQSYSDLLKGNIRVDESYIPNSFADEFPMARLRQEFPYLGHVNRENTATVARNPKQFALDPSSFNIRPRFWHGIKSDELDLAIVLAHMEIRCHKMARPISVPDDNRRQFTASLSRATSDHDTFLKFLFYDAPDSMWREYLIDNTQSPSNRIYSGDYLDRILGYHLIGGYNIVDQQRPTHGGWSVSKHLRNTAICLRTDDIDTSIFKVELREIRCGLRMAALHHDLGKLVDNAIPGIHRFISRKIFIQMKPIWVSQTASAIAELCIIGHDVFARLARGVVDLYERDLLKIGSSNPRYVGACCPGYIASLVRGQNITESYGKLLLVRRIWEADTSAVPLLQWAGLSAEVCTQIVHKRIESRFATFHAP